MDSALDDGTYDAVVVEVDDVDDDAGARVWFVITAGAHKGETIALRAARSSRDPLSMLGLPARVVVTDGQPRVSMAS